MEIFINQILVAVSRGRDGSKWHGASALSDSSPWRRIGKPPQSRNSHELALETKLIRDYEIYRLPCGSLERARRSVTIFCKFLSQHKTPELGLTNIRPYKTGNEIFNRSLRLLARTKGYKLNQRGLYKDVMLSLIHI